MLRPLQTSSSHEDLFIERYQWLLSENSPVSYLDRVQTPLLILQGTSDDATALTHSDQVFVFLRS